MTGNQHRDTEATSPKAMLLPPPHFSVEIQRHFAIHSVLTQILSLATLYHPDGLAKGRFKTWRAVETPTLYRAGPTAERQYAVTLDPTSAALPCAEYRGLRVDCTADEPIRGFDLAADADGPGQCRHRGLLDPPAARRR